MHEDENFNEELDKSWIRKKLTEIRDTIKEWGVKPFQEGTWLAKIIQKSFRNYWEKGNNNEIDIVAINELEKKVLFAEVKINPGKINLELLKLKAKPIILKLKGYTVEYKAFSINEM